MEARIAEFIRRSRLKKAEYTAEKYESHLKYFRKWVEATHGGRYRSLSGREIENHLLEMVEGGYAPDTIRARYDSVKALYDALTDAGDIEDNPIEEVDITDFNYLKEGTRKEQVLKQDIFYITSDEKESLCGNVPNPPLRNELLIRLLWQTGVRVGELVEIRLSDLNREDRNIQIRASKTYQNRKVYYQSSLDFLLDQWIDGGYRSANTVSAESDQLLLTYKRPQMRRGTANDVVKNAAHNADIQEELYEDAGGNSRWKITAHTLRHSFAVQSLKNGMDVRSLQILMGHKRLETTKRYLKLTDDDLQEAVRRFGPGTES